MKITINNRTESFEASSLNVDEILKLKNYTFKMMVIKVNGKLVKKDERQNTMIKDGDDVQIIHMISGG